VPYCESVTQQNIKFHYPNAEDPDWKVKQSYIVIIAAASELENGIKNL